MGCPRARRIAPRLVSSKSILSWRNLKVELHISKTYHEPATFIQPPASEYLNKELRMLVGKHRYRSSLVITECGPLKDGNSAWLLD